MSLSLITFNYKTTPLALREKLAVPSASLPALLGEARTRCALEEVMMLSTCNRVELYYRAPDGPAAGRSLLEWMKRGFSGWDEELEHSAVMLHGEPALTHIREALAEGTISGYYQYFLFEFLSCRRWR